jgi:hypothetical protein
MNVPQNETSPEIPLSDERLGNPNPSNELLKNAVPIGKFAGPQDFVLRFHDGKLVAANSGKQGGGQN